jgi:hypothetical protein
MYVQSLVLLVFNNKLTLIRHISGFSNAVEIDQTKQWTDLFFVAFGLVQYTTAFDQVFPVTNPDAQTDINGWKW